MTDEEKIEDGADTHGWVYFKRGISGAAHDEIFKGGVKWRDANPNPKVLALVEALEKIAKKVPHQVDRAEAADMACEFVLVAREALAVWKNK